MSTIAFCCWSRNHKCTRCSEPRLHTAASSTCALSAGAFAAPYARGRCTFPTLVLRLASASCWPVGLQQRWWYQRLDARLVLHASVITTQLTADRETARAELDPPVSQNPLNSQDLLTFSQSYATGSEHFCFKHQLLTGKKAYKLSVVLHSLPSYWILFSKFAAIMSINKMLLWV